MAFPAGWGRKCALVIQASQVDANLSNFPVLLTKDTLPSEMFDADGSYPALSGGGDIRFSSDSAGNTQLACEIVTFTIDNDPANGVAEIWVKVPSVASGTNTTLYVWYNKSGETQPAIDSAYGSENVWDSDFKIVQHMKDATTSTVIDSTSNDNDGTKSSANHPAEAVGQIGKGQDFDGSNDIISIADASSNDISGAFTLSSWVYLEANKSGIIFSKDGYGTNNGVACFYGESTKRFYFKGNGVGGNDFYILSDDPLSLSTWYYLVVVYEPGSQSIYLDNVKQADTDTKTDNYMDINKNINIGDSEYGDYDISALIDEVHCANIGRSADWIKAEHNNQYSPATFVVEGTPSSVGVVAPTSIFYGPLVGPLGGPI